MSLRIAIPNKGRLMEDTIDLLRSIGLRVPHTLDRSLIINASGGRCQVLLTRAQDIPEFVEIGAADLGITGLDLVEETGCRVERLLDLAYGQCKLIVAAPEHNGPDSLDDLPPNARIATSYPNLTKRFFDRRKRKTTIVPITGAAEITPYIGVSDAIVDLTQTGATLKQNHLVLLDTIMDSRAVFIGCRTSIDRKKQEIEEVVEALRSVQEAAGKRYLMANVPDKDVKKVVDVIPGLTAPTVMNLAKTGVVAVHAVVDEDQLNAIIPKLKKAGASGILVIPIERIIP
ncbi:MAG: ATP phosphoribosyltransferase [Planctomycetes bacterium]|nr:ATP phosphoribosyltransferase [Planctomycetota bacterium]